MDDIQSKDVTYTFQYQRYGTPKISEDTFVDSSNVSHPRTFVRWMSPYDQVNHVFTLATPFAAPGFANTGGHLCYAVTVDNIVIPDGTSNVATSVNLTASGGETPFKWTAAPVTRYDINHDGRVNLVDVLIVIMHVGRPC